MKTFIKLLTIFCGITYLSSCASDYLNTVPTESTSTSTIFETTENAKLAVNGICKLMTRQYLSSQGLNGEGTIKMYYGNYGGNHFTLNLPGWATVISFTNTENPSSVYNYFAWYYYYMLIGNANSIIAYIDDAAGPENEKKFIKAQALTFRAYSFMMLAQIYCYRWSDSNNGASNGLVLRIDTSDGDMPLSTLIETYARIYNDLDDAIELYKASELSRSSSDNYSPDLPVAYAVYARAALNRQDYATASSCAKLARASFPLMNVSEYKAGFCNPNSEWIWSSFGSSSETLHFYSYFAYIAYNSSASVVRTYPKLINRELYTEIPATDIRRGLFLDPTGYTYATATGQAAKATYPGLYNRAFELYPDINNDAQIYAYMQLKIKANDMPGVGHLNHFRSSEMYLIEAESAYYSNKPEDAHAALNALIKDSGRDPQYSAVKTGADLLEEIKFYRNVELWGEGFDWFDMKRWGDTIVRKTYADGGNVISALAKTITPSENNKWTYMIPLRETDYNSAIGALPE